VDKAFRAIPFGTAIADSVSFFGGGWRDNFRAEHD
jgi:hypothetical protein